MLSHMGAYPSQVTNGGGHQCGPQSDVTYVARSLTPAGSHGLGPGLGDQDGGSCGSARRPIRNVA